MADAGRPGGPPVFAIASGKGGTGKTFLAVNLALVAGEGTTLVDADAEEPNGHLFLHPTWEEERPVTVPVPRVDEERCTLCGDCRRACRFNAIALLGGKVLVYPELCHACGACLHACPVDAVREEPRAVGATRLGRRGELRYIQGLVTVGEARSTPVIEAVRARAPRGRRVIIDAPPGTTCPTVAAVKGADYVLLVTEPTPFGLHDLKLAVAMCRALSLPCGVVINRSGLGSEDTDEFCRAEELPVLARIPFRRRIAEVVSNGGLAVQEIPEMKEIFAEILDRMHREARK